MYGAPQHALAMAAAILAQTGQRYCAVSVPCDAGRPASDDNRLPSERSAPFVKRCCIFRSGMISLQSSQAIASTMGAAITITRRDTMRSTFNRMTQTCYIHFPRKASANSDFVNPKQKCRILTKVEMSCFKEL